MPKISVIVTTYNREELLTKTVNSILAQTMSDFELIIVDNYSDYNFIEHVDSFHDDRIKAFQHSNNGIISINRNFGFRKSVGDFIALCDDDDVWEPRKLELQLAYLETRNTMALVCCASSFINQMRRSNFRNKISELLIFVLSLNIVPAKYLLMMSSYITNSSVLFNKKLIIGNEFLNESDNLKSVEDLDLWLRVSHQYPIYFMSNKLVRYRIHQNQFSGNNKNWIREKTILAIKNNWIILNPVQKLLFYLFRYNSHVFNHKIVIKK